MRRESPLDWGGGSARLHKLLEEARSRISNQSDLQAAQSRSMHADPWIVSSVLQKAIRRGEVDIAQRAAAGLLALRGSAIWRRFIVIAFEDVGIGSVDALLVTVAAASDASLRSACGGDVRVAAFLTGLLAEAPKDRSADYLAGARDHPDLARFARTVARATVKSQLCTARDETLDLQHRAIGAYFATGFRSAEEHRRYGDLDALVASFRALGVPDDLAAGTDVAARRTREPITLMIPLIWLAARPQGPPKISNQAVPNTQLIDGIPLYGFDKHTRLGKRAIRELVADDARLRICLEEFVPRSRWLAAAEMAAFYADAAPISRRLEWPLSRSLEALGTQADFAKVGVPLAGIEPLLSVMAASLGHLNEIRKALWLKARGSAGV
jgi:hypothetical protein